ncbi:hypothetical protein JAB9_08110 [Janthinobacterium sp. HH107]|nr:hypothetical protein JAB9_08110 [Janthinobacterium sp. HH107]
MAKHNHCSKQEANQPVLQRNYFRVGMANSAPAAVEAGQRCVTAFCFV